VIADQRQRECRSNRPADRGKQNPARRICSQDIPLAVSALSNLPDGRRGSETFIRKNCRIPQRLSLAGVRLDLPVQTQAYRTSDPAIRRETFQAPDKIGKFDGSHILNDTAAGTHRTLPLKRRIMNHHSPVKHPATLWSQPRPLLIGMLHIPPLPGSPQFTDMESVRRRVLHDAEILATGGVTCLMLENLGDVPFFPGSVPPATVAHMTALAVEVRQMIPSVRLGVNVLRNDGLSALSIAHAAGADFIRVNVLCGARVTDQGVIQGIAHDLLRLRTNLHAEHIAILADVDVKHSAPLARRALAEEVHDLRDRGLADAVIVSGPATGAPVKPETLTEVISAAGGMPVLIGSGVTPETIPGLQPLSSGFIAGTSLKQGGDVSAPVDPQRVRRLVDAIRFSASEASSGDQP